MTHPNQSSDLIDAVRLSVARAISDAGLTPSQAEAQLAKMASQKEAGIGDGFKAVLDVLAKSTLGLMAAGGAVGAYTGHKRNQIERSIRGEEDPEVSAIKKKTEGYRKMTEELRETLAAQGIQA